MSTVSVMRLVRLAAAVKPGCRTWKLESPNVRAMRTSNRDSAAVAAVAPANNARSRLLMSTPDGGAGEPCAHDVVASAPDVAHTMSARAIRGITWLAVRASR